MLFSITEETRISRLMKKRETKISLDFFLKLKKSHASVHLRACHVIFVLMEILNIAQIYLAFQIRLQLCFIVEICRKDYAINKKKLFMELLECLSSPV